MGSSGNEGLRHTIGMSQQAFEILLGNAIWCYSEGELPAAERILRALIALDW